MKKIIYLILTIIWMGVIFYFSHQPGDISGNQSGELLVKIGLITEQDLIHQTDKAQMLQFIIRKVAHMSVYFILSILLILTFKIFIIKHYYLLSWIIATVYAITDEFHQSFIPDRGPSVKDVFIDSFGALIGLAIYIFIIRLFNQSRRGTLS
ncbi:VanZ family protein [Clostridium sp. D2Q-11]|uniref:VanZ family protein n=1 Tax=Anaeromonas frigoriresistens TaxID=2683708 RepID=A0A942UUI6_9FIRM|nr:VanZ family protein [Anaeromonas frigoriresistens]MBS4538843.1 VanZ family protein [Anaeromonas frigoriresistens]